MTISQMARWFVRADPSRFPFPRILMVGLVAPMTFSLLPAANAVPARSSGLGTPNAAEQVKTDKDNDKIFDDLEGRLTSIAADQTLSVIVTLSQPATDSRLQSLKRRVGRFDVSRRFSVVDSFAAALSKRQLEALAQAPEVAQIEENSPVRKTNDSAQQSFGVAKARLDAPGLDGDLDGNPDSYSAGDLVAAVIDTGIDPNHRDLDEGKVIGFKDLVNGRTAAYDDDGHGTHVAATLAGDGDGQSDRLHKGVAPAAALVGVKILDAQGNGSLADVIAGIDWVVTNKGIYGIEALNISLGAAGCASGTDATSQAVGRAHDAGLVVVAAAGNEGPGPCTVGTPGAAPGAITVGAMADIGANGFRQASFSSRGSTADGRIKPDISAPGVAITSATAGTASGYSTWSGTSMATPFVAGLALLALDVNPGLTSAQVKDVITATAVDWGRGGDNRTAGTRGPDADYGFGRLDAYAALGAAGATLGSPPPVPVHEMREDSLTGTGASFSYPLNVYDTSVPIAATLIMPTLSTASAYSPNFDLYLFDPNGIRVAAATSYRRQDDLAYRPTTPGTYVLRVVSRNGRGEFFVDVSAGLATDTTSPAVMSVSPPANAQGVDAASNMGVTFSEPMNQPSAQGAFILTSSGNNSPVGGSFSWNGTTMTFDPVANLAPDTQYTAAVTTAARDQNGNPLGAEVRWSFRTAASSRPLPPTTTTTAPRSTTTTVPPSTTTTVPPSTTTTTVARRR